ncbi:MAG: insulinase family protein [Roseburia sp.]|nr:insulinase family protein [Roseburia sp.]MCM1278599.1 insulinase family protein [Robinsoniella sp.]
MKIEQLNTYETIEAREIKDLNSYGRILKHKKTGAKIVLLENDDENKVFYIGFRTPPTDSTGVAHILEHSVLCGSKSFPSKDPFVELAKGSLNTFLNAMTYPDKTVYPVASCNDKDFQNLMHVYLDAVFYPNIYAEPKIFMQEGWHYHLEEETDSLKYNGVVYNEMKGAFSSPDDVLDREIFNSLFPDTAYGNESGGDPKHIPDLTYEQFLDFHRKYYHPSNSYIYLYGNVDMAEKLAWIDEQYLSHFDYLEIDSTIGMQEAFKKPMDFTEQYSVTENESLENATYLSYNTVVGTSLDRELYVAFSILDYVLCSAPGAPVKQALIDKNIGQDVYSLFENGIYQPYFSIVAKNANEKDKAEFIKTIEEVLKEQVKNGIDKRALKAGLNYYEFKYKEADFGSYPKGLMYGLQALDSWLYDDRAPFYHIEANETFRILKEKINTDYFEGLVETYLLQNTHKVTITVVPVAGLTTEMDQVLQKKLDAYKNSLTDKQVEQLVSETNALISYQETESPEEDLKKIPLLKREDMKKEAEPFINKVEETEDVKVLSHNIFTNGVSYLRFVFDAKYVSNELLPYMGLLKNILGLMNTEHYGYGELFNEVNIATGGIVPVVNTYVNSKNLEEFKLNFEIKAKTFYENTDKAYDLVEEILFTTKLSDEKRLLELIRELKAKMQAVMLSSGHSLASVRSMSYFSKTAAVSEQINGIPFYRLLEELDSDFEKEKEKLIANLEKVRKLIFRPENFILDYTGTEEGLLEAKKYVAGFQNKLYKEEMEKTGFDLTPIKKNEGFKTSAGIQYVALAGNFLKKGLSYTGALKVLKVIMGYEYLWNNVRVKGGAYGCMSSFGKSGDCYFVSYRDPNLEKTLQVYRQAAEFIRNFQADERTVTKFIIGALSELDAPKTPAAKGSRSMAAYLCQVALEEEQKERDELLAVDEQVIRSLAAYIEAFVDYDCICVVGNEEAISQNAGLFMEVENLFH